MTCWIFFRPTAGRGVFIELAVARPRKWWLEQPAPSRRAPDATVSWNCPRARGLLCEDGAVCLFAAETNKPLECTGRWAGREANMAVYANIHDSRLLTNARTADRPSLADRLRITALLLLIGLDNA
eukprot:9006465-Pyramimonas_sp.AAC.1